MVHKNVALFLGGGGSAGHAWTIGVIAGLAEAGIDMTEAADLVIGTSSGATAAAQVRSGIPPAELLASTLSQPVPPVGQNRPAPSGPPMAPVFDDWVSAGLLSTTRISICLRETGGPESEGRARHVDPSFDRT